METVYYMNLRKTGYLLLMAACAALLSLVCAEDGRLPSGEMAFQWLWFDRAALAAAACIVVGLLLCRKGMGLELDFSTAVSWALIGWAAVQAVIGLRQVFGFEASGHALYALTGSFFNPGPYAGYLAMALPVCLYEYCIAGHDESFGLVGGGSVVFVGVWLSGRLGKKVAESVGEEVLEAFGCCSWNMLVGVFGRNVVVQSEA